MQEFTSEDDLNTFEGWLRYQAIDATGVTPDELKMWRDMFDQLKDTPKVGLMKLRFLAPGEYRYAVAVREGSDLWLALWVKRAPKGDVFIMIPRADRGWDPHVSYHRDGRLHMKSHGRSMLSPEYRQPLSDSFRRTEHLTQLSGYGPKRVGAICNANAFSGIVELPRGVLGPRDGVIFVDLVEPGCKPMSVPNTIIQERVFCETSPWIVIRVGSTVA